MEVLGFQCHAAIARQHQQGVHERFHRGVGALDARKGAPGRDRKSLVSSDQVRRDADHRQRRAQLVAGVAREVAFPGDERIEPFTEMMQRFRHLAGIALHVVRNPIGRQRLRVGALRVPTVHFPQQPVHRAIQSRVAR